MTDLVLRPTMPLVRVLYATPVDDRRATLAEIGDRHPGSVPRWGRHPIVLGLGLSVMLFAALLVMLIITLS